MSSRQTLASPAALSYYTLRKAVGVIALSLPFALPAGRILLELLAPGHTLSHPLLQQSISDYYYTPVGDVLVGSLCAIATILICTRGYSRTDQIAGYIAGVATLGVGLFPSVNPDHAQLTQLEVEIGFAHSGFAALMFLTLAYFCLVLFRRTSPGKKITRRKQLRNRIYAACGVVILACNALMASLVIPMIDHVLRQYDPLLLFETLSLVAFGVAWLTKGEGLMKDRPPNQARGSG